MAFASINAASSGANTLVAAVSGQRVVVTGFLFVVASAVTVVFKSGSTALTGTMSFDPATGNPGAAQSFQQGLMQTAAGEALVMTLGGAVQVSGYLVYELR